MNFNSNKGLSLGVLGVTDNASKTWNAQNVSCSDRTGKKQQQREAWKCYHLGYADVIFIHYSGCPDFHIFF